MSRLTYHGLLGRRVIGPDGRELGRVHDLEAEADGDDLRISALLLGASGFLRRLTTLARAPRRVPWEAIESLDDGVIRCKR